MAMWTIKSVSGNSPGDAALRGCRILAVPDGGGGFSYQLLPATGRDWIATSAYNPPLFVGFSMGGLDWNVYVNTTAPRDPPNGSTLAGRYWNNAGNARPESGEGSWQAEATGGGSVKGKGHPSKKSSAKKSSAKSPRKSSAKKSSRKTSAKKSPRKSSAKKSSAKSTRKRSS
jgi:hypothetical protein